MLPRSFSKLYRASRVAARVTKNHPALPRPCVRWQSATPAFMKPSTGHEEQQQQQDSHSHSSSSSDFFEWPSGDQWRDIFDHLFMVAGFLSTITIVRRSLLDVQESEGPSMEPTLNQRHDFLGVLTFQPWRFVKVGDIVIAKSPNDPHQKICKRVIGMSGDKVIKRTQGFFGELEEVVTVPEGHVWLQGDNLSNSYDSRSYGAIPMALITGVAFCKIYPFWQFSLLKRTMKYSDQPSYLLQSNSGSSLTPTLSPIPAFSSATTSASSSSSLSHYVSAAALLPLDKAAATEAAPPFESRFTQEEQEQLMNEMKLVIEEEKLFEAEHDELDQSLPARPLSLESPLPASA